MVIPFRCESLCVETLSLSAVHWELNEHLKNYRYNIDCRLIFVYQIQLHICSSSSSIFNVNIIIPTSRGDILRQIVSSVYIT